ncbi:hypothetical protein [Paenibacillus tarimensis]|uniref:hypothetical protein n=1 Tax=Paenibacillus tarimensis TaxID=416012 RepID=UPI001F430ACA|nr:hypothetical protein [Paenibacillus tarimensis]MCF2945609.1 hypothetical protein [Paenibacillus tarimensis]
MKRKTKVLCVAAAVAAAGVAAALYQWWTAPYDLPEISKDLTIEQYGLDMSANRQAQQSINALPAGDEVEQLKQSIEQEPGMMAYSNKLRILMLERGETEQFLEYIDSLETLTDALKLQQALAYVDLLQNPDLGTAALGQISSRSISVLNNLLEDRPYDLFTHYARGLNNLYWPSGLQRTGKAIQDLGYCLAVAKQLEGTMDLPLWPLIYTAYGDALVKDGQVKEGILVWKDGAARYTEDKELQRRASLDEQGALDEVRAVRGIDEFRRPDPSISDLSIVWTST